MIELPKQYEQAVLIMRQRSTRAEQQFPLAQAWPKLDDTTRAKLLQQFKARELGDHPTLIVELP